MPDVNSTSKVSQNVSFIIQPPAMMLHAILNAGYFLNMILLYKVSLYSYDCTLSVSKSSEWPVRSQKSGALVWSPSLRP